MTATLTIIAFFLGASLPTVASYFLARQLGRERPRPPLASYGSDDAPGDCWPVEINPSHFGTNSTEA